VVKLVAVVALEKVTFLQCVLDQEKVLRCVYESAGMGYGFGGGWGGGTKRAKVGYRGAQSEKSDLQAVSTGRIGCSLNRQVTFAEETADAFPKRLGILGSLRIATAASAEHGTESTRMQRRIQ